MASPKKYKTLDINIVMIDQDIITQSLGGSAGGDGGLFGNENSNSIIRMSPLDRPLGIFKRD